MADMAKMAVTAKRLIDLNGRTVTLVKHGNTPADSDKPWRGISSPVEATVTGKAVFVPRTLLQTVFSRDEGGVKMEGEYALFAANDDGGNNLELFNVLQDGGRDWKIKHVELIAPGDTRVLYMIEVER